MGLKYSKLTPRQTGELLQLFVAGSTARTAVDLVGVHRNTAALFFSKVRAVIADCGRVTLVPIIRRKVAPASVVYSDSWAGYDTLSVEASEHERINHDEELVADGGRHITGIENFWSHAKRHLRKFNGVRRGRSRCSSRSACGGSTPEHPANSYNP